MDERPELTCANPGEQPGEDMVLLRLTKVNEILRYVMNTIVYAQAEPIVRELKAEVERCNGPR